MLTFLSSPTSLFHLSPLQTIFLIFSYLYLTFTILPHHIIASICCVRSTDAEMIELDLFCSRPFIHPLLTCLILQRFVILCRLQFLMKYLHRTLKRAFSTLFSIVYFHSFQFELVLHHHKNLRQRSQATEILYFFVLLLIIAIMLFILLKYVTVLFFSDCCYYHSRHGSASNVVRKFVLGWQPGNWGKRTDVGLSTG
jgi:hypothetical protein